MWLTILWTFEGLSAIAASIYFYKYGSSFLKYICVFLWYTLINEVATGLYFDKILEHTDFLFNIHQIINFALIYWLLINSIKDKKRLLVVHILFGLYVITQIIDIVTKDFISGYLALSYFTGGFVSLLGIMYYAIERLKSYDITPIRKDLTVWFLMGNLIFWIGYLPIYIIFNNYTYFSDEVIYNLAIIRNVFIVIQNVIFILGFIWSEKRS